MYAVDDNYGQIKRRDVPVVWEKAGFMILK